MAHAPAAVRPITPALPVIPLSAIAPWLLFAAFLLAAVYFVGADQGAATVIGGELLHEFAHDGRHLLGFPCH
ncbi:MAG: CbtB-domain containing protein [Pseudonocardiaceae bacterium]|nr:CbtB-domain containing protein [Pseudonocardiaceae bacterium]